ncbi:hypothetical protein K4K54_004036 [Colletotrichum sp. SAR 10_86]|nr:hypothetical protein KHU50_006193 [Colletotrichum sp. SAR 10_65]KAI8177839.1 hypothetical protein K4K51_005054 [Colletotrichum sp. SAR 10_75]KAI8202301.1 hypothetical protein K4K52_006482 [Colletotrichum sp. SAR 10_76]KAI8226156.1 hypothetical protein K4K54_004036 [Colletotrichum sp. SAR 10_86]
MGKLRVTAVSQRHRRDDTGSGVGGENGNRGLPKRNATFPKAPDAGGGAFGSPEEWNEQLQSLQKHVVSTSDKNLERAHQWATTIAEEFRAARNLVAEMEDAENVPNVSTEQFWPGTPEAIASSSRLQLFELCFHEPFVPDDSQPISLHFDSFGPGPTLQYSPTLVVPTPSPPAYSHEVHEFMDFTIAQDPPVFFDLEDATTETCRRASALLSLRQAAFILDPNNNVGLVCYALHEHIKHARTLWSNVYRHAHDNFFGRPLRLLQCARFAALGDAYRDLLFDRDHPELGAQCIRCSPDTTKSPLEEAPGVWHFACDSSFPSTLTTIANPLAAVADLRNWALRQSRRRLALLRQPSIYLDGKPLFPNNQHPYHEAGYVVETKMPMEDDFNALTRHVFEPTQGLRDLLAVLDEYGLPVVWLATVSRLFLPPKPMHLLRRDTGSSGLRPRKHSHPWMPKVSSITALLICSG